VLAPALVLARELAPVTVTVPGLALVRALVWAQVLVPVLALAQALVPARAPAPGRQEPVRVLAPAQTLGPVPEAQAPARVPGCWVCWWHRPRHRRRPRPPPRTKPPGRARAKKNARS
jgi:hypothetical protein